MLLNLPSRFGSVIWVVTPIRFNASFTSFVVGTKFSALDLSGLGEALVLECFF